MALIRNIAVGALILIGGSACRHGGDANVKTPKALPPPAVIVESDDRNDDEVTSVEVIPPDQGETSRVEKAVEAADEPTALNGPLLDRDRVRPPAPTGSSAVVSAPSPHAFAEMGLGNLRPQTGATMEGNATVMTNAAGVRIGVRVRLATPGRYDVFLLDPSRRCDEKRDWREPIVRAPSAQRAKSDNWNLGIIEVNDMGIGDLDVRIPESAMRGGVRTLDQRAIVIFEGLDRPLAQKRALSCGVIRFSPEEQPVG
jgi:hypothetical protein